jgi:hypothetical protein
MKNIVVLTVAALLAVYVSPVFASKIVGNGHPQPNHRVENRHDCLAMGGHWHPLFHHCRKTV